LVRAATLAAGSMKNVLKDLAATENKEAEVEELVHRIGPAPGEKALAVLLMSAPKEVQEEAVRVAERAAEEQRCRQALKDEEVRRREPHTCARSTRSQPTRRPCRLALVSSCVCVVAAARGGSGGGHEAV
jgi:hypothetical protein